MGGLSYESLSARRAWIEMKSRRNKNPMLKVALRKESVDRNTQPVRKILVSVVALRKESVDRNNAMNMTERNNDKGRSPQGERG